MFYLLKIINLKRLYKQFIVLVSDIFLSLIATILSIFLTNDLIIFNYTQNIILFSIYSLGFIPFFISFGLYRKIFRYTGYYTIFTILNAIIIFNLFFYLIIYFSKIDLLNISFTIVYSLIFFVLVFSSRITASILINLVSTDYHNENVIIYGVNEISEKLLGILNKNIYCIISDNVDEQDQYFNKYKIINSSNLITIVRNKNISKIYYCEKYIDNNKKKILINQLSTFNVGIIFLDKVDSLYSNQINSFIDNVELDTIMNRNLDFQSDKIINLLNNRNCLVTGGGGSIGSQLCLEIIKYNINTLYIVDNSEYNLFKIYEELKILIKQKSLNTKIEAKLINLNDKNILKNFLNNVHVDILFHVAAYKHVELVEKNVIEAINNNIFGTINLLDNLNYNYLKNITLVSSDKAVKPINIMGQTKRFNEILFQKYSQKHLNTIFSVVRFGNVVKSAGSVIPKFINQIKSGSNVTVTDPEVKRYFMSINEAVSLILNSTSLSNKFEIYYLQMGEQIKIVNIAKKIINLSGYNYTYNINEKGKSIPIEFVGLKKGEKLEEDLFDDANFETTNNDNILQLNKLFYQIDTMQFDKELENLKSSIKNNDIENTKIIVKKLINKKYF